MRKILREQKRSKKKKEKRRQRKSREEAEPEYEENASVVAGYEGSETDDTLNDDGADAESRFGEGEESDATSIDSKASSRIYARFFFFC